MSRSQKREIRARQQMQQEQEDHAEHRQMQQAAFSDAGRPTREYLDSLTETPLDADTIDHLQNLLSKDFVLSKLQGAEKDELKWLTRNVALRVTRMHPPEDSYVQGEYRKFLYDDEDDGMTALSDAQEEEIWHVIMGVFARVARSEGGWQQEEFGKVYAVTERRESDEEGRLDGLFPGGGR